MKFTIPRILIYLCFVTAIYSCTNEKEYLENNNRDIKISRKPFKDLLLLPSFNRAYEKVKTEKQKNSLAKSAIEDEFNFTIVEGKDANIIEKDGKTFYNILIKRDSVSTTHFENLLIKTEEINNIEQADAYLIKYKIPSEDEYVSIESDKEITALFSKESGYCFPVCIGICTTPWADGSGGGGHFCGGSCTIAFEICTEICIPALHPTNGVPTPNNDGSQSGSGGGGGGGTPPPITPEEPQNQNGASNDNEVLVLPVFTLEAEENLGPDTPCQRLKNLFSPATTNLKASVNDLFPTITQTDGENGVIFNKASNGYYSGATAEQSEDNTIKILSGNNVYGCLHTHPSNTTYPMFSWSDISALNDINNALQPHNQGQAVMMVAVKDDLGVNQLYAVVFNDETSNTIQNVIDGPANAGCTIEEIRFDMDKAIEKKYNKEELKTIVQNRDYEKAFLQQMSGLNVSLYKSNSALNNWTRLSINPATGEKKPNPCKK